MVSSASVHRLGKGFLPWGKGRCSASQVVPYGKPLMLWAAIKQEALSYLVT